MISLRQFCRALAAHHLLGQRPELLHTFMTPEIAEETAGFIHRFALGERIARPERSIDDGEPQL